MKRFIFALAVFAIALVATNVQAQCRSSNGQPCGAVGSTAFSISNQAAPVPVQVPAPLNPIPVPQPLPVPQQQPCGACSQASASTMYSAPLVSVPVQTYTTTYAMQAAPVQYQTYQTYAVQQAAPVNLVQQSSGLSTATASTSGTCSTGTCSTGSRGGLFQGARERHANRLTARAAKANVKAGRNVAIART